MSDEKKQKGLLEYLAGVDYEETKAEFKKEKDNPEYKAQAEFHNCGARAASLLEPARVRKNRIVALAIAYHRSEKINKKGEEGHNENHKEEIAVLESQLSKEDISVALQASRGFWRS